MRKHPVSVRHWFSEEKLAILNLKKRRKLSLSTRSYEVKNRLRLFYCGLDGYFGRWYTGRFRGCQNIGSLVSRVQRLGEAMASVPTSDPLVNVSRNDCAFSDLFKRNLVIIVIPMRGCGSGCPLNRACCVCTADPSFDHIRPLPDQR